MNGNRVNEAPTAGFSSFSNDCGNDYEFSYILSHAGDKNSAPSSQTNNLTSHEFKRRLNAIIRDKMESLLATAVPAESGYGNGESLTAGAVRSSGFCSGLNANVHEAVHRFSPERFCSGTGCFSGNRRVTLMEELHDYMRILKNRCFISEYLKGLQLGNPPSAPAASLSLDTDMNLKNRISGISGCLTGTSFRHADFPCDLPDDITDVPLRGDETCSRILRCLENLRNGTRLISDEIGYVNYGYLRNSLTNAYNEALCIRRRITAESEPVNCCGNDASEISPVTDTSGIKPLLGLLLSRPELTSAFVGCPIPLEKIAGLRSLYLLTQREKALGYLYLLFNNLSCFNDNFRADGLKIKRAADRFPNDNTVRHLTIRAMTESGLNITSSADFTNADLPEMYHHYMIRNRRYHLKKYGMKKFVTRSSARRKDTETLTSQASSARLNRISLFLSIYEMLTDRHRNDELIINDPAVITSMKLYRQSLNFLDAVAGDCTSETSIRDDMARAVSIIRNTAGKNITGRNLDTETIKTSLSKASSVIFQKIAGMATAGCLTDMPAGTKPGTSADTANGLPLCSEELLQSIEAVSPFELFSEEMQKIDRDSRDILNVMRKDSYADAVSAYGFSYKSFTNATKLPYDTMHRFFTPEDRAAVKKELFCQSRDKGRL